MLKYRIYKLLRFFHLISKKKFEKHTKKYSKDYRLIACSRFFSVRWYRRHYLDLKEANIDPVDHYLRVGWKEGMNPSKKFNTNQYLQSNPDVKDSGLNPLVHYELYGKKEGRTISNLEGGEASSVAIAQYWKEHKKHTKVVYTCIVGRYDHLINHKYISRDCDYICFTDDPVLVERKTVGVWQIRPLVYSSSDSTRNSRWHKIHPHELFPDYEESIWVDGNVNVLTSFLFDEIRRKEKLMITPCHFRNNCIYYELDWIVQCGKDTEEHMAVLRDKYRSEGLPENLGFAETNIFYRKHHSPEIVKVMELWWHMVEIFSKRDQASLVYALWKNKFDIRDFLIPNARMDGTNYQLYNHS